MFCPSEKMERNITDASVTTNATMCWAHFIQVLYSILSQNCVTLVADINSLHGAASKSKKEM